MIDKRMMYALGQRVGGIMGSNAGSMLVTPTRDGSRPGYAGPNESNDGQGVGAGTSGNNNTGGDGGGRPNMADIAGPVTGPVDMSHFGDTGDIVQADFTPYNQRPDTITDFKDNYIANFKSQGLKNLIPGMGVYNLINTMNQTKQARDLLGLGPAVGPGPTDDGDGDGQGIMQVQPNMLNVAGPVVEDETINTGDGDTEFVNRFEVSPEARQAQGVAALLEDQAIAEMISKLYT